MSTQDPRIILALINETYQRVRHWQSSVLESIDDTEYKLRLAREKVSYCGVAVQNTADEVSKIKKEAYNNLNNANSALSKAEDLMAKISTGHTQSQNNWNNATALLTRCKANLTGAENNQSKWEQECFAARKSLEDAAYRAELANIDLNIAHEALSKCQNYRDSEGRRKDCSEFSEKVKHAESVLKQYIIQYEEAKSRLEHAHAALAQAKLLVNQCTESLINATRGEALAAGAVQKYTLALDSATTSVTHARNSVKNAKESSRIAADAGAISSEMKENLRNALKQIETSESTIATARQYESEGITLTEGLHRDLSSASDALHDFESQTL